MRCILVHSRDIQFERFMSVLLDDLFKMRSMVLGHRTFVIRFTGMFHQGGIDGTADGCQSGSSLGAKQSLVVIPVGNLEYVAQPGVVHSCYWYSVLCDPRKQARAGQPSRADYTDELLSDKLGFTWREFETQSISPVFPFWRRLGQPYEKGIALFKRLPVVVL
jgi:hypothetical protein